MQLRVEPKPQKYLSLEQSFLLTSLVLLFSSRTDLLWVLNSRLSEMLNYGYEIAPDIRVGLCQLLTVLRRQRSREKELKSRHRPRLTRGGRLWTGMLLVPAG